MQAFIIDIKDGEGKEGSRRASPLAIGIEAVPLIGTVVTSGTGEGRSWRGGSVGVHAVALLLPVGDSLGPWLCGSAPVPEGGDALRPDVLQPEPGAAGRAEVAGLRRGGVGR